MSAQPISLAHPASPPAPPPDSGAAALALVAALNRRALDLPRLLHEHGRPGQPLSLDDLVLAARRNGFRARAVRSGPARLARTPLPAIARDRAGLFFVLARHEPGRTLIQYAG